MHKRKLPTLPLTFSTAFLPLHLPCQQKFMPNLPSLVHPLWLLTFPSISWFYCLGSAVKGPHHFFNWYKDIKKASSDTILATARLYWPDESSQMRYNISSLPSSSSLLASPYKVSELQFTLYILFFTVLHTNPAAHLRVLRSFVSKEELILQHVGH